MHVLAPILQAVPPATPPVGLLERIEAQIESEEGARRPGEACAAATPPPKQDFTVGIAVLAVTTSLLAGNWYFYLQARCAPRVVTALDMPAAKSQLRIETVECARYLRVHHRGIQIPGGQSLELWLFPHGSSRPVSLGLLAAKGTITILPLRIAFAHSVTLAVSLEPSSGASGKRPSGPIVGRSNGLVVSC